MTKKIDILKDSICRHLNTIIKEDIPYIEFINSKRPSSLKKILGCIEKDTNIDSNIYTKSYYARERILNLAHKTEPIQFENKMFVLPPLIENRRKTKCLEFEARKDELINTVKVTNEVVSDSLGRLNYTENSINKINKKINDLKILEGDFHGTFYDLPKTIFNDNLINWYNPEDLILIPTKGNYNYKSIHWGCDIIETQNIDNVLIKFKLYLVNLFRQEGYRFLYRGWFEYDGAIIYSKEINEIRTKIIMLTENRKELLNRLEIDIKEYHEKFATHIEYLDNYTQIENELKLIYNNKFPIERINEILNIII